MTVRYKVSPASGNLNGVTTGTFTGGSSVAMGFNSRKISNLSAVVNVTAATSTITLTGQWQGSNDNSTWVQLKASNNAANVTISTGTASATGDVSYDAPPSAYGFAYVRFGVVVGVTTGATGDLYAIAYSYRQLVAGDGGSA